MLQTTEKSEVIQDSFKGTVPQAIIIKLTVHSERGIAGLVISAVAAAGILVVAVGVNTVVGNTAELTAILLYHNNSREG